MTRPYSIAFKQKMFFASRAKCERFSLASGISATMRPTHPAERHLDQALNRELSRLIVANHLDVIDIVGVHGRSSGPADLADAIRLRRTGYR